MLIYILYRFLGILLSPLIVLYLFSRGVREPRYFRGLDERLGFPPLSLDATLPGGIWLHAVSVGEVLTAVELLKLLRANLPGRPIYVSVTTLAGRALAEDRLKGIADSVFFAPLDYCGAVRRVLRRLKPRLVVVMETEIWPNLFRESKRAGCGLLVVNGRISDRAFPKYLRWRWFFRAVLQHPDRILVQNATGEQRYAELGAPAERIRIIGNLKYDFQIKGLAVPEAVSALIKASQPEAIWIAASTMPPAQDGDPDEDDVVIAEHLKLADTNPRILLILAPRRPERFDETARKLRQAGVYYLRRSTLTGSESLPLPGVLLLDTVGELSSIFSLADAVFMGGTLARRGGHNILEPAFFAKPVIIGPHMENFPDIGEEFRASGAVEEIAGGDGLAEAVERLLSDRNHAERLGRKARELAESKRGVTAQAVEEIMGAYTRAVPGRVETLPSKIVLGPLQWAWRAGTALDRARKQHNPGRLKANVISVGGISMGGAGKTPVVAWLAEQLNSRGMRVGILTRGYKRRSPERQVILAAGESCTVYRTGDEAQLLLRRGHAALGIGGNRLDTGMELERLFQPDVILLDDGFQHWKLERDVDLVLIDSFEPLGLNAVFPLGRLREPLKSLARASGFLITRSHPPLPWTGLEEKLRAHRPGAPVFYCGVQPVEWVEIDGKQHYPPDALPSRRVAAFCGLGNPASFWSTLHELGIAPELRWSFGDHHSYRQRQLQWMGQQARAAGVELLLTTEKDTINLPVEAAKLVAPLRICWLRMDIRMEASQEFLAWLLYNGYSTRNDRRRLRL